jgi:hypothetical protein
MFRYYLNFGAKWAELMQLMQKFMLESHDGIFRNKRNRSTPLDPKLMFQGVLDCFIIARKSVQNG